MKDTLNKGVAYYFRGRISENDNRYCVMGAGINSKPDEHGRRVMSLNISIDGETVVDYDSKRDGCPKDGVDWLYRSFFDGTLWNKLKLSCGRKNYAILNKS